MMQLVFSLAIIFVIIIYPVMLAARFVGAGKTGFGSVVFALFLLVIAGILIRLFVTNEIGVGLITIPVGSIIYSFALDTTILRGFAISILAVTIVVVAVVLLSGVFGVLGM
jgi:hypothetical protein